MRRTVPGADAVYGDALDGVDVVPVPRHLAPLLAEAHWRIRGREAGIHRGGGTVVGRDGEPLGPPTQAPDRWVEPDEAAVRELRRASNPIVLAGPDVVLLGAVAGLHAMAAAGCVGVVNTWGAKGVFDWRSRHHLATAGLQARDWELAGFGEADLIVATGLHRREALGTWQQAPVVHVHPWSLGPLAERWQRPPTPIAKPPLFTELARITQDGWEHAAAPLPPSKLTQHYGRVFGGGGLVAADPGTAGYWVARTVGTTGVGGVLVPGEADAHGFAVAAAIVSGLLEPDRPALAVVDRLEDVHHELLDLAAALEVPVAVEVWRLDGPDLDADEHEGRLLRLVEHGGVVDVATDGRQLRRMVAVAGPIVAWTA
jgi:hypothetical protein